VTERTGLSPHVLRAWERRYGVVHPQRSDGGQRLYSDADIRRLAQLLKAVGGGRSIGQVAALSAEDLQQLLDEDADRAVVRPSTATLVRGQAMTAIRRLDPDALLATLRRATYSLGTPAFLEGVLAPLLVDIGREWHAGRLSIAQEHAATAATHQLLAALLRDLAAPDGAARAVLATPSGEPHCLGAMIAAVVAAHDGWHVTWLGADLPAVEIATAALLDRARLVAIGIVTADPANGARAEVESLRQQLDPGIALLVGGARAGELPTYPGVTPVRDLAQWRSLLQQHAPPVPSAR
jgi:DNA-binding transcriptional MerR regulator